MVGPDYGLDPFDTVVVDGPATGDSTEMLRVPEVIRDLAPLGRLRRDAESCWELLHDPVRTSVVVVTTLEELPVIEAEILASVVRQDLQMPLGPLIVNRTTPALFLTDDARKLAEWLSARQAASLAAPSAPAWESPVVADGAAIRLLELGAERAASEQISARLWSRLAGVGLPLVPIPLLEPSPAGPVGLSSVATALAQGALGDYRPVDS
jgi:anion-transporting  ArsA/GET3 family ATPase